MKRLYATFGFILWLSLSFSQQNTNIWYFGLHAGLDFSSSLPVTLNNGILNASEGCASICDSTGSLLFYTDGRTVYNKMHQIMINGTGLFGGMIAKSTTQAAIIIPQPSSNSIFFIFTVDETAGALGGYGGISYSIVDMSLQGGVGEITTKNIPLLTPTAEKISAVQHNNGVDIWIITQQWGTNSKYAWLLTSSGLSVTPIVSNVGIAHNISSSNNSGAQGYMKFSPNGENLASVIGSSGLVELFNFDNTSGFVTNPITINANDALYGLEFSASGQKLYCTSWSSKIYQWDLSSGIENIINNSKSIIYQTPFSSMMHIIAGLQLGKDCRIYVAIDGLDSLGIISNPEMSGLSCNYIHNAISLQGNNCRLGLPNFIQSYFSDCITTGINAITSKITHSLYPNPFTSVINFDFTEEMYFQGIPLSITIKNVLGQIVYLEQFENKLINNSKEIQLGFLNKGIYFFELEFGHSLVNNKIIKAE